MLTRKPSRSAALIMVLAGVGLLPSLITNPSIFGRFHILCFALLLGSYAPWVVWWRFVLDRCSNISVNRPEIPQLIWSLRSPLTFFLISIASEAFVIWQFYMSAMTIEAFPHYIATLAFVCFYAPVILGLGFAIPVARTIAVTAKSNVTAKTVMFWLALNLPVIITIATSLLFYSSGSSSVYIWLYGQSLGYALAFFAISETKHV